MPWPSKCPLCGGEIVEKTVEKVLRGGNNTAILKVGAGVCLKCGEHLYTPDSIRLFEEIRRKLESGQVADLTLIGKTYSAS